MSVFSFWGIASLGPLYRHPVPGTTSTTMGGVVSSLDRELSDVERPSTLPALLGMPAPPSRFVESGGGPPPLLSSSLPVASNGSVAVWAWAPPVGLSCLLGGLASRVPFSLAAPGACVCPLAAMGGAVDPYCSVGGFVPWALPPLSLCPCGFSAFFEGMS